MQKAKSFDISKHLVMEAWVRIKSNGGSAGIDKQSISDFEKNLKDNLYRIWNRMSSGSYQPSAVKLVEIPKSGGGKRPLGIPTVTDRVCQMVTVMVLEPLTLISPGVAEAGREGRLTRQRPSASAVVAKGSPDCSPRRSLH